MKNNVNNYDLTTSEQIGHAALSVKWTHAYNMTHSFNSYFNNYIYNN